MVAIIHQGVSMATLVLKGVPEDLRRELKGRAEEHRRSVTQEAIGILEMALKRVHIKPPAKPLKLKSPVRMSQIVGIIRESRT
jgi:plasmid stability protein